METERNTEDDCLSPKEQKVAVNFIWSQPDFSPEATVVDLILGHALGANNDIFEMYMEGTTLKENTPISEYRLDKMTDSSNCTSFDIKINLPKNSYQFLFRIEDVNNLISLAASESYKQIQLVSGRTINYLEIDDNYSITKEDKDGMIIKLEFFMLTSFCYTKQSLDSVH